VADLITSRISEMQERIQQSMDHRMEGRIATMVLEQAANLEIRMLSAGESVGGGNGRRRRIGRGPGRVNQAGPREAGPSGTQARLTGSNAIPLGPASRAYRASPYPTTTERRRQARAAREGDARDPEASFPGFDRTLVGSVSRYVQVERKARPAHIDTMRRSVRSSAHADLVLVKAEEEDGEQDPVVKTEENDEQDLAVEGEEEVEDRVGGSGWSRVKRTNDCGTRIAGM